MHEATTNNKTVSKQQRVGRLSPGRRASSGSSDPFVCGHAIAITDATVTRLIVSMIANMHMHLNLPLPLAPGVAHALSLYFDHGWDPAQYAISPLNFAQRSHSTHHTPHTLLPGPPPAEVMPSLLPRQVGLHK